MRRFLADGKELCAMCISYCFAIVRLNARFSKAPEGYTGASSRASRPLRGTMLLFDFFAYYDDTRLITVGALNDARHTREHWKI